MRRELKRHVGRRRLSANLDRYTLIDLFSGAGGFTRGFVDTGRFIPVLANDIDQSCAATYNRNFGHHCATRDIRELLEDAAIEFPKADVVIGGPPCQGFSLLNKQRIGDPRRGLWSTFMDVVERVEPKAWVMENVPELLSSLEFVEISRRAKRLGYELVSAILNAADYGVPQRRKRAIVFASRVGTPRLPEPEFRDPALPVENRQASRRSWKTVRSAIGRLPSPVGTELRIDKVKPPMDLHFGRKPTRMSLMRYRCVPEGGNRWDLERRRRDLTPRCWIKKKSGGTDLFGRLWWDRPAFTIRTEFFKPEKGRYLHPKEHRPITHREAARLQTFPDDFRFTGSKTEIAIQIGNAVPCLLARRIAEVVRKCLDQAAASKKETHRTARSSLWLGI